MKKIQLVTRDDIPTDDPLLQQIRDRFEVVEGTNADADILVIGGDGTMLHTVQNHARSDRPFFGLNRGHIGFLMNEPTENVLDEIMQGRVEIIRLRLLQADLFDQSGEGLGMRTPFNDLYVERSSVATAKIRITIDGEVHFDPLISDGVIVCTPAGSTAYTAAAGGQVIPLDSRAMVLTGICPMMFHHWRSSILSESTVITLEALQTNERPVRFLADGIETPVSTTKAVVRMSSDEVQLGFAASQHFRRKVVNLQLGKD